MSDPSERPVEDFEKWCCPPSYIIGTDGKARRIDGKPLDEYDRGWLAAKDKMVYHLEWSREQRAKREERKEEERRRKTATRKEDQR